MSLPDQIDWVTPPPPFQKHSPTSREAASNIVDGARTLRARVLAAIIRSGEHGRTDEELQVELRMNPSTQRPRRIELVTMGCCIDSGAHRPTKAGRKATVWIATRGKQS